MRQVYPISLIVEGRCCIVVGGGAVAARKVGPLLNAGARVRVIAPTLVEELARLAQAGRIEWLPKLAEPTDIAEAFVVIVATDDRQVNAHLAAVAEQAGKLVNVVDQPANCNFFVPASVQYGPLLLTVSTGGASPALAKRIRHELSQRFGPEYGKLAELLDQLREDVIRVLPKPADRSAVWERILDSSVLELLRQGKFDEAEKLARTVAHLEA
ncbi:MAG: precorrin-2 dehydrogenase/sirohydrochlorin ferrochelatase family protein [Candidatus Zipacnadales bacterium]